jgi:hypothetical protein
LEGLTESNSKKVSGKMAFRLQTILSVLIFGVAGLGCVKNEAAGNAFVGSTPGDDWVKLIFGISPAKKIDFIRWFLTLNEDETFSLNLSYGEGQPNTSGFRGGGEKLALAGSFTVKGRFYELKSESFAEPLRLVKLNENLFHLLTADGKLMTGNGGWSYTLNKKDPAARELSVWRSVVSPEATRETVFDGRTPCSEIAREYRLQVVADCIKIKWRLTLYRDAATGQPSTYNLRWVQYSPSLIEGKWRVTKKADSVIYQLSLDQTGETLSFLVGDENVLFFLDKGNQLLTGNGDFSFTLNRRK